MIDVSFFARLLKLAWSRVPQTPIDPRAAALDARRFDGALTSCATALDRASAGSQRALVQNKLALAYLRHGNRAAAIAAFVDALEADVRCIPVIVNVGNLLLEDGNLDEAVAHYEAALRIDDTYAAAHLNLGVAYKRLGRRFDAVRAFRRAHRIEAREPGRRM